MWPRLRAILAQRCPVCLQGRMFRGVVTMNAECPVCGHHFTREQGFFQGALFIGYGLGVALFFALFMLAYRLLGSRSGIVPAMATAVTAYLLCVPMVFRYSRVIWAHLNIGTVTSDK